MSILVISSFIKLLYRFETKELDLLCAREMVFVLFDEFVNFTLIINRACFQLSCTVSRDVQDGQAT
jgi:hypothetical protein